MSTRRLVGDRRGQSALYDSLMFFVVMLIGSGMVLSFSTEYDRTREVMGWEDQSRLTVETAQVMAVLTVGDTWYEDATGETVPISGGSATVTDLVLLELVLLQAGLPQENFATGLNEELARTASVLVNPNYHYALTGEYTDPGTGRTASVFISDTVPDYGTKAEDAADGPDHWSILQSESATASIWSYPMAAHDLNGTASVGLHLWST